MNEIDRKVTKGTFAELLVQIRLLQYNIQSAPPIKDSGNDLIAVWKDVFKSIQIKSTSEDPFKFNKHKLPNLYHILALVLLDDQDKYKDLRLDECKIFLLESDQVDKGYFSVKQLENMDSEICEKRVDNVFDRAVAAKEAPAVTQPNST